MYDNGKMFEYLRRYYKHMLTLGLDELSSIQSQTLAVINKLLNGVPGILWIQ